MAAKQETIVTSSQNEMIEHLQGYLQTHLNTNEFIQVTNFENFSSGWESDLYTFTLKSESQKNELILRLYNGQSAEDKAENEHNNMRRLLQVGYPVPKVYTFERSSDLFGKPFIIMQRVPGKQLGELFGEVPKDRKMELGLKFCQLYVQLHQLDWRLFADQEQIQEFQKPYTFIDHWLNIAYGGMEAYPDFRFSPLIKWIESHRKDMACNQPAVTHNDFHAGNLLLLENGEIVVIDWTGFNISDARFDLAWTLLLINAYSGSEWYLKFLQAYEQIAGTPVKNLKYFEVFACARRIFDIMVSLKYGAENMGMRPEAVEQMKASKVAHQRVYEMLVDRTGLSIPAVEALIESL